MAMAIEVTSSGRTGMLRALICAVLSAAGGVAACLLPGGTLCFPLALAWPLALAAVVFGARLIRPQPRLDSVVGRWNVTLPTAAVLACALVVFLAESVLVLSTPGRLRQAAKSAVTAANLRGIGQAVAIYAKECGSYPSNLDDLVAGGVATQMQFLSFADPAARASTAGPPYYSSFAFRPGLGKWQSEADVILACERLPWTPMGTTIFPKHGRMTLFGDGHVVLLDESQFEAALARDEQRRRELGWPIPARP